MNDESSIERVLRAAGGRDQPSEALERYVRAAVHAEWRATIGQRARIRRQIGLGIAASLALVALGLWASRVGVTKPHVVVASVSHAQGAVSWRDGSWIARWIPWRPIDAQQSLRSGENLMTGPDGRVALAWANGISLRLDRDTRIALLDTEHIDVRGGAVYVDTGGAPNAQTLEVKTSAGALRHLGTQYEVRLLNSAVRIRVREGRVELNNSSGVLEQVQAGEQLLIGASGRHERASIEIDGAEWNWASEVAPPFDIEGRSLREFLAWASRESGRQVVFVDTASETEAARATLHGSIAGLTPAEALDAVLPTTALRSTRRNGQIVVQLQ